MCWQNEKDVNEINPEYIKGVSFHYVKIMNQVLVAQKKAEANVIMRREETASTRSLLNTAKLMDENSMLFKLKEMEYVEKIADKINSISLSGGNQIVDQLKDIFVPKK